MYSDIELRIEAKWFMDEVLPGKECKPDVVAEAKD